MCRAVRRGRARQRLAPTPCANPSPIGRRCITGWCHHARPVGVRRCLTRRPAGPADRTAPATHVRAQASPRIAAPMARAGEAPPRPYNVGRPIPGRVFVYGGGALTTLM